jgi:hypothetical protein
LWDILQENNYEAATNAGSATKINRTALLRYQRDSWAAYASKQLKII